MPRYAIEQWGTPEQKKQYLPALAKGETLGALALFENGPTPGVGPDALIATKQAEGWVLNGKKAYVRNAGEAGVYVVFATADAALGAKALTALHRERQGDRPQRGTKSWRPWA